MTVLVCLLLTTVLCLLWSLTQPKRTAPLYHYANFTLITELVHTNVTSVQTENNSFSNNSGRYVHGCYNKGTIGTVQLLLNKSTLKTLGCKKRSPQVVIFGARKSGTGTLRDFLSFHPQLAVADSEIHYLEYLSRTKAGSTFYATKFRYGGRGNSIRIRGGEAYRDKFQPMKSLKTYTSLMPYSTPQQLVVEKTPKYFVCKNCPILLHKMIPDCKLIAILRDPVERAISGYAGFLQTHRTIKRLSPSLGMEETFEKTVIHDNGLVKRESPFIDIGIYKAHIKRWMSVFPKAQILLLDGGEFVKKPESILRQVEKFLGIKAFFTSETFEYNKTKGFYCLKRPIKSCMGKRKGRKHPYVSPKVIKKLQQFYEPHNKEFSKFVNQKFSWTVYT
ncbi:Heparan sulfate glucosamine 3-O-sulfotransferase 1 [Holothuria leucospilota]|uniref:Heparan sulfate glucosamine 3-O-sulfotransferase 1 n=1 Tax=Holothuria leucospilota TaxID=206669 RepID=A0A9Q1C4R2_HOLLE|nr:Heparan sulfate glucosamine 3-O-sulfotransferase 1 [Holothuria leucospilota]